MFTNIKNKYNLKVILDHECEPDKMARLLWIACLASYLRKMRSHKFYLLVSCTSLAFLLLWVHLVIKENPPINESLIQEVIQNVGRDFRYTDVYQKTTYLPKNLKYILLWTDRDYTPFSFLKDGQRSFLMNNCSVVNCYVTANRNFFGSSFFSGSYTKFDAIAFNGRNMKPYQLPRWRSPHQKYIYFNTESSDNYPVCQSKYDGFFNLTATYKLNSDIPLPYILIKNEKGEIVGPKRRMQWRENMVVVGNEYIDRIENKSKAAAWFVSNCLTRCKREDFVKKLHKALYPYGFTIDVYGKCGHLTCSILKSSDCDFMLKRDYFFYMSLENSFAEDYVTEKLLTALNNDIVPIVYGGADYSRFLPPGSYIDARQKTLYELAATIYRLAHTPQKYSQFLYWKRYYTYHDPTTVENVCSICKALNDKSLMEKTTTYNNFRYWWNPDYKSQC